MSPRHNSDNTNPLVFNVAKLAQASATSDVRHVHGPAAQRIGLPMIAIEQGSELDIDATLTPLGGGILVDASVESDVHGQCSRCLAPIDARELFRIEEVFALSNDFIEDNTGDDDEDADVVTVIEGDEIDLTQALIDVAGLTLPFNPVCEDFDAECSDEEVPAPDGVSGETVGLDPRWAALEKFKGES